MVQHTSEDAENQGFTAYTQIPIWLLRGGKSVSNGAFRLYAVLKSYTRNGQNTAFPSQKKIAEDIGVSERQVYTYMHQLRDAGAMRFALRVKENGSRAKHYEYTLAWDKRFPVNKPNHQKDTSTGGQEDETPPQGESLEENFHRSPEESFDSSVEENFRLTTPNELHPKESKNPPVEEVPLSRDEKQFLGDEEIVDDLPASRQKSLAEQREPKPEEIRAIIQETFLDKPA